MRIAHISDVDGDLIALGGALNFAANEKLDLVVCSGGMLNSKGIEQLPAMKRMKEITRFVEESCKTEQPMNVSVLMRNVMADKRTKEIPILARLQRDIREYLDLQNRLTEQVDRQYAGIRRLLDTFSGATADVLVLPGIEERHLSLYYDQFSRHDAHGQVRKVQGLEFAGYGGGSRNGDTLDAERAADFFQRASPDVIFTYVSPRGIQNGESGINPNCEAGPFADFISSACPDLWLCGFGSEEGIIVNREQGEKGIIVNNPGRLGRLTQTDRSTFAVIEIDPNADMKTNLVRSVQHYTFHEGKVSAVEEHRYVAN